MRPRTITTLAVSGILMGSASMAVIEALLGPDDEAPASVTMEATEFRGSLTPEPLPAAAVGGTATTEAISVIKPRLAKTGPARTGPRKEAARVALAMSTRVDQAMVEGARSRASWSPESREHPTSRRAAQARVPEPKPDRTAHASKWLPAPPPAKPELALTGDPDRAPEREQEVAAPSGAESPDTVVPDAVRELGDIDHTGAAEALVRLPDGLASPRGTSEPGAAEVVTTALQPGTDWAEALSDTELGDLRGAGVDQVVIEMLGDTTVNDETSEIDATLTLDSNGQAKLDGTLPNGLSLEGEGVQVETVFDGMENFRGLAQVIQIPGSHNVVTANLLINMFILMNEGVLPPNLVDLSAARLP